MLILKIFPGYGWLYIIADGVPSKGKRIMVGAGKGQTYYCNSYFEVNPVAYPQFHCSATKLSLSCISLAKWYSDSRSTGSQEGSEASSDAALVLYSLNISEILQHSFESISKIPREKFQA